MFKKNLKKVELKKKTVSKIQLLQMAMKVAVTVTSVVVTRDVDNSRTCIKI